MRKYPFVLVDVQRFYEVRLEPDQELEGLAIFAEAGFGEPELFLDLGRSGRYYLYSNANAASAQTPAAI